MGGDGTAVSDAPALRKDLTEEEAIRAYFRLGYTNSQLCAVWKHCHGIQLTIDQVKKRLVKLELSGEDGQQMNHLFRPLKQQFVSVVIYCTVCVFLCP